MKVNVETELTLVAEGQATLVLNIEAARTPQQFISAEQFTTGENVKMEEFESDGIRYRRLKVPQGEHKVRYVATVSTQPHIADPSSVAETPIDQVPFPVLTYTYPSRYCQSDKLDRLARHNFCEFPPGHHRVTAICNWIYENIDYEHGSSDAHTSVHDTLVNRAGVCRDFAHLGIALCRALTIPARYVSCYAPGLEPPDFHAVFEAYLDGRWYLFDATRQAPLGGLARIGAGRDAADVSIANLYGPVQSLKPSVLAKADPSPSNTTQAFSLAQD
jgi:transglutaminase-like putative cysteine protease